MGKCIVIPENLKSELDKLKTHKRDTYGDLIQKLVDEHHSLIGKHHRIMSSPEIKEAHKKINAEKENIQPDVELPSARRE